MRKPRWQDKAACSGLTTVFFSDHVCDGDCDAPTGARYSCKKLDGRSSANIVRENEAREICRNCPVLEDCRTWITTNPEDCKHGIVAGMTEATRRRLAWSNNSVDEGSMWSDPLGSL